MKIFALAMVIAAGLSVESIIMLSFFESEGIKPKVKARLSPQIINPNIGNFVIDIDNCFHGDFMSLYHGLNFNPKKMFEITVNMTVQSDDKDSRKTELKCNAPYPYYDFQFHCETSYVTECNDYESMDGELKHASFKNGASPQIFVEMNLFCKFPKMKNGTSQYGGKIIL